MRAYISKYLNVRLISLNDLQNGLSGLLRLAQLLRFPNPIKEGTAWQGGYKEKYLTILLNSRLISLKGSLSSLLKIGICQLHKHTDPVGVRWHIT